jgi:hypothetical protein
MNSDNYDNELFKKKLINKTIELEQIFVKEIFKDVNEVRMLCLDLSRKFIEFGILVILKDSKDLSFPNKIHISVIVNEELFNARMEIEIQKMQSPLKKDIEEFKNRFKQQIEDEIASQFLNKTILEKTENDLSENFYIQLMDPNKESTVYDFQEDCDSQTIYSELNEKMTSDFADNAKQSAMEHIEEQLKTSKNPDGMPPILFIKEFNESVKREIASRIVSIELFKGQSSQYYSIPKDIKIKIDPLTQSEIDSLFDFHKEDGVLELLKQPHEVSLSKLSNSHSQFSEGKIFKISYNLKSKCKTETFISCCQIILSNFDYFDFFSTIFSWCGKATLKSCDESVNLMRQLFSEYSGGKNKQFSSFALLHELP